MMRARGSFDVISDRVDFVVDDEHVGAGLGLGGHDASATDHGSCHRTSSLSSASKAEDLSSLSSNGTRADTAVGGMDDFPLARSRPQSASPEPSPAVLETDSARP
jgi:hypothetical protein